MSKGYVPRPYVEGGREFWEEVNRLWVEQEDGVAVEETEQAEATPRPVSRVEHAIATRERIDRERRIMQRIRNNEAIASMRKVR
jgi:hypothetical protein